MKRFDELEYKKLLKKDMRIKRALSYCFVNGTFTSDLKEGKRRTYNLLCRIKKKNLDSISALFFIDRL